MDQDCNLDPRIKQVMATISASTQKILILRPDGASFSDIRPMVRFNISLLVEKNGRRENGYTGIGGRNKLLSFLKPETWKSALFQVSGFRKLSNLLRPPIPVYPFSLRPFFSTKSDILNRTIGLMSEKEAPSGLKIRIFWVEAEMVAITCLIRGSRLQS